MTQNGGTHAVKACALPFRADWDRSRPAGYLATADHIALSDREVPGERAEPPIWSARPGPVAAILPRLNGCSVRPGSAILGVNVMAIAAAVTALCCALPNPPI
jgi:hypothetical protein